MCVPLAPLQYIKVCGRVCFRIFFAPLVLFSHKSDPTAHLHDNSSHRVHGPLQEAFTFHDKHLGNVVLK